MRDADPDSPDAEHAQDAALLGAASRGDRRASRALVERELPRVLALAERMTRDRAEAQDIAQDAFLRLWGAAADWRPRARIGTWLATVTYRLALDRLRRARRWSDAEMPEIADPAPGPDAALIGRDRARAVDAAIRALPDRQRAALALVHEQGLSGRDAAATMEISEDALESLLARARRRLRQGLAGLDAPEREKIG